MSGKPQPQQQSQPQQQQPQPTQIKLHWSPVEPSWILAVGLTVLAVLPHQVPRVGRRVLQHPIGSLLFAGLSAFVCTKIPVLGAAMFIFHAGLLIAAWTSHDSIENFTPMILNKEDVQKKGKKRWLNEEIMSELPDAIQEKTDNTYLNYDQVTEQEARPWAAEDMLGEHPVGIQDRAISTEPDYDDSGSMGPR